MVLLKRKLGSSRIRPTQVPGTFLSKCSAPERVLETGVDDMVSGSQSSTKNSSNQNKCLDSLIKCRKALVCMCRGGGGSGGVGMFLTFGPAWAVRGIQMCWAAQSEPLASAVDSDSALPGASTRPERKGLGWGEAEKFWKTSQAWSWWRVQSKLKRNGYLKGILVVVLGDSSHFLSLNPHNYSQS